MMKNLTVRFESQICGVIGENIFAFDRDAALSGG